MEICNSSTVILVLPTKVGFPERACHSEAEPHAGEHHAGARLRPRGRDRLVRCDTAHLQEEHPTSKLRSKREASQCGVEPARVRRRRPNQG